MSDIREDNKLLSKEEKEELFFGLLTDYLNNGIAGELLSKKSVQNKLYEKYGNVLSPDEIMAIANISQQLMEFGNLQELYFKKIARRREFIEMICINNREIKRENVQKIVSATVADIVGYNKYTNGNREYDFNVYHVMDIVNGQDPYRIQKQELEAEKTRRNFKIVK